MSSNGCASPPTTSTVYSYDAEGNDRRFTLNARNQTTLINNTLAYAGPNQWELITDGTATVENNLLGAGRTITGTTPTAYYRDPSGGLLARRVGTGAREFYDHDRLGSVRGLTTSTGTDAAVYDYWPYGEPRGTVPGSSNPFRYAGGYRTPGTVDAYHFGMRWYDTGIMRWTQRDPLDQADDLAQANRYGYAAGDPANLTDPEGTHVWVPYRRGTQLCFFMRRCVRTVQRVADPICVGTGFANTWAEIYRYVSYPIRRASAACTVYGATRLFR